MLIGMMGGLSMMAGSCLLRWAFVQTAYPRGEPDLRFFSPVFYHWSGG